MKKWIAAGCLMVLMMSALCGCGEQAAPVEEETEIILSEVVEAIKCVNPVKDARVLDEFSVENELMLDPEFVEDFCGEITNSQEDCALVFAAEAVPGHIRDLEKELETYKISLSSNDLYVEFADKVAQAKEARIAVYGNYIVMVVAGLDADYSEIDSAIETAFA